MKKPYADMTAAELQAEKAALEKRYNDFKAKDLKLDMSRGKPGSDQLDLSNGLNAVSDYTENGVDLRNYGMMDGTPACKKLFADLMQVKPENVIVGPNASLTLMFDYISQCFTHGAGDTPWCKLDKVKFLCPVPGYDRHFTILEHFGIEMVNIDMKADGPDMDAVEDAVQDPAVKGMFCVPKYSNPQGITYSDEVVRRIAALKPAAKDFRVIWDNAYMVHDIVEDGDQLLNIFDILPEYGNEDMVIEVCSTSKITFPGAGVSALAASDNNIKAIKKRLNAQTISYDKMNQHRHVQFFKDVNGILAHMKKHAAILKPKFDMVLKHLDNELSGLGIASWTEPKGGYFISLDVLDGCAKRVGELCKEAGVVLTTVGATYPYGKDPNNRNIRIAPTYPPTHELDIAAELLCVCVRLAAVEKILEK
ncbi:MAG TPA: aminotransferase class I/II-fold pyridoxal phosphate-dependent enzyme [Candidatus Eubacterium faecipullorum]|uniref:Aminotransferase class I/II-fold pyridoxal phosphate-dependent enzyme n=1 Tax=Candidatus Eubacterium faecipullorum TaxID=2838571 RepID=A0A9D1RDT6_9FIRM|nr:aminotransferase class I/II-fold pyridoxal phosphate-dependent enzyme [Candidatus Eubacterium faecipullorum]